MGLEEDIAAAVVEFRAAEGTNRDNFLHVRERITADFGLEEWTLFVREWQATSVAYLIPELIGGKEIQETLGIGVYTALGIPKDHPNELLEKVFDNYGIFDDEKCRVYLEKSDQSSRQLLNIFFSNEYKEENAKTLIRYAWEHQWKETYGIPELIGSKEIEETLGKGVYTALKIPRGHPNDLFEKVFDNYGIFDDEKCRVYLEKKDKASRHLLNIFFSNEYKEENAKTLIRYVWEHQWKDRYSIPELIGTREIEETLGIGVYTALGIPRSHPNELLEKVFDNYGIFDETKADLLCKKAKERVFNNRVKGNIRKIFFQDSLYAAENCQYYLEAYQRQTKKRLCDLTDEDYKELPPEVSQIIFDREPKPSRGKRRGAYHHIHIKWTGAMEERLRGLYAQHEQRLFDEPQLLWDELGITPFAALMKAGVLGIIPERTFGDAPTERRIEYPFVFYQGYQTPAMMLDAAEALHDENNSADGNISVNAEGFSTPINGHGFHVQLPILYKGTDSDQYTREEQLIMKTMATYLADPSQFRQEKDTKNLSCFVLEGNPQEPHTIVPVKTENGSPALVKVYLPKIYAADPGAVFDTVFQTETGMQLFFFYHTTVGQVL